MTGEAGSRADHLARLQRTSILVLGDVMLDRYTFGEVHRVSPEGPVPVVLQQSTRLALGGAANVAANISSIGARAILVGRVGADQDGREIMGLLDSQDLVHHLMTVPGIPTITKTRIVAGAQQIVRIDNEKIETTTREQLADILGTLRNFFSQSDDRAVVLADYAKGFLSADLIREVIRSAAKAGIPVVADPKGHDLSRYAGSTVIKPNLAEARSACASLADDHADRLEEIMALTEACQRMSGARNVVLSCSADGVAVSGADVHEMTHLPTKARDVADVSGAGDTLVAIIALGLAAKLPLARAVEIANMAAGAVCEKPGTATVSATELLALIGGDSESTPSGPSLKLLANREEAGAVAHQYHLENRRLVFANGCFDLLHAGHIKLLKEARSHGDALMVGLNADESVRRLKGPNRPIQAELDRCEIIAALECVDFVVVFNEDTPLELINAVQPDVIVKGDDYNFESVIGASEVAAWGGSVVLVTRLEDRSTTGMLKDGL